MPPGQLFERLDRIVDVEVDDLGALRTGHLQACRDRVDRENPSDTHEFQTGNDNWPTGPQPNTATVFPGRVLAISAAI
jgi:hypothetical protein